MSPLLSRLEATRERLQVLSGFLIESARPAGALFCTPQASSAISASVGDLKWALARIRGLEAALKAAKREHGPVAFKRTGGHGVEGGMCGMSDHKWALTEMTREDGGKCLCGAEAHNAAIDVALKEDS